MLFHTKKTCKEKGWKWYSMIVVCCSLHNGGKQVSSVRIKYNVCYLPSLPCLLSLSFSHSHTQTHKCTHTDTQKHTDTHTHIHTETFFDERNVGACTFFHWKKEGATIHIPLSKKGATTFLTSQVLKRISFCWQFRAQLINAIVKEWVLTLRSHLRPLFCRYWVLYIWGCSNEGGGREVEVEKVGARTCFDLWNRRASSLFSTVKFPKTWPGYPANFGRSLMGGLGAVADWK